MGVGMRMGYGSRVPATWLARVNAVLTCVWLVLAVPAIVWWRDSVPFLVGVSVYANVAGHLAAWQGARAEQASTATPSADSS